MKTGKQQDKGAQVQSLSLPKLILLSHKLEVDMGRPVGEQHMGRVVHPFDQSISAKANLKKRIPGQLPLAG